MLLRIEVFPPVGKGSSTNTNDSNRSCNPSQTLYCSPSTVANRLKAKDGSVDNDDTVDSNEKSNRNAGLVVRIGRKGDVDILFGADRSISREHALLRFVGSPSNKTNNKPKPRAVAKRRTSRRKHNDDNDEEEETKGEDGNRDLDAKGWFLEPRNEDEAAACEKSPHGMCLVLENMGKSGSYMASEDKSVEESELDKNNANNNANAHDNSDATTDGEGGDNNNTYNNSQANVGTATSLATQTGEILVSRRNLAPSQSLPSLSSAVQHYFGTGTPVKLTKIDANESQILSFGDDDDNDGDNNKTTSSQHDVSQDRSILIQFGIAQLPTIKITKIPMTVVFSSGVPASIQNSLCLCGGLVQEAGTLPRSGRDGRAKTTHLVTTERMAVAKQLIAWCYEIPIVSPDFVQALGDHVDLENPFPKPTDYPARAADTKDFWESKVPRQDLLSNYIMLSADPSPEVEQAEGLAQAAGAKITKLYDKQKKHTKAKVTAFVKQAKSLLQNEGASAQRQRAVLLTSTSKSKSSNANTVLLLKTLKEELAIPIVSSKMLAKTITQQESRIVGLKPMDSGSCGTTSYASTTEANTHTPVGKSDGIEREDARSPEWELQKEYKKTHKRSREETSAAVNESVLFPDNKYEQEDDFNMNNLESSPEKKPLEPRKRLRMEQNQRREAQNDDQEGSVEMRIKKEPLADVNETKNITNGLTQLGGADANGWFSSAPKDDGERSRWRQRASDAYRTKTGVELEQYATTNNDLFIIVDMGVTSDSARDANATTKNHHRRPIRPHYLHPSNVPNFKKFQKNRIVRADPSEGVVLLTDALSASKKGLREMNAEERELEEDQRLADAPFRGDALPGGMGQKRRLVRK